MSLNRTPFLFPLWIESLLDSKCSGSRRSRGQSRRRLLTMKRQSGDNGVEDADDKIEVVTSAKLGTFNGQIPKASVDFSSAQVLWVAESSQDLRNLHVFCDKGAEALSIGKMTQTHFWKPVKIRGRSGLGNAQRSKDCI